ncbi:serine/threonine protein kinase [Reinekea marinisedimentorum]|uniref:Stress response kinase A n=1 Tax=Reinekea marinisedimentorum TaxID=230495 RepID=A0A4R3I3E2_9GAMM|nr:serine/threonine protein kinase [Reinekea marinisedimentorum]TCS40335.1 Ser/Thr protein kinase RdoA (MazF antagonist) [Reinekea marinisedimentorum]
MHTEHPYSQLTQDKIIDWLESLEILSDYRIYPLNSYENRVYRVGIEDAQPIVMKVYRPGRWSREQIQEELEFTQQLFDQELPVVPALSIQGQTLHERDGFLFACFPMRAGHAFELDNPDKLYRIGQLLGRVHSFGSQQAFKTRTTLSLIKPIQESLAFFQDNELIGYDLRDNYLTTLQHIETNMRPFQTRLESTPLLRTHGDFHAGNILTRDEDILLVDFDDTQMAPAMQDIWKLLSGSDLEQKSQLSELAEGYEQFYEFPDSQARLIEPLRTAHMVRHNLWIAKRWSDPAFPQAFPWYGSARYWSEHLLMLKEQWSVLQDLNSSH